MDRLVILPMPPSCTLKYSFIPKIFISYCTRSNLSVQLGDLLKKSLEEKGFDTFLDRYDIRVGESFVDQIDAAIHDCHGAVLLLSGEAKGSVDAKGSVWVADEAAILMARKQRLEKIIMVPALMPPIQSVEDFFGERSRLWKMSDLQGLLVDPERMAETVAAIMEQLEPLKGLMDFWGRKLPLSALRTLQNPKGVERLNPWARYLPLIGREGELQELCGWLNGDNPVSVRALIGGAGRGKTRLAMELGHVVEKWGWHAGFLPGEALEKLVPMEEYGWSRPTLAVIDYAAQHAGIIHKLLSRLGSFRMETSVTKKLLPLRILLLERVAEEGSGWWQTLLGFGGWGDVDVQGLLDPPKPVHLAMLTPEEGENILFQMLEKAGVQHPTAPQLPPEAPEWRGEPLFAMMAGQLLAEQEDLPRTRTELAIRLARREMKRIASFAQDKGQGILLNHLAAFVTLCGGLEIVTVRKLAQTESEALDLSSVGKPRILANLLHQALPGPQNGVDGLRPDIIGEALILLALGGGDNADSLAAVQRAFSVAANKCISSLVRCGQDFIYAGHQEPLEWLGVLIDNPDISLDMLWTIEQELPLNSLGLDAFAARLRQNLLDRYRILVSDDKTNETLLSGQALAANNLSNSLSNLGRHEAALAAIEEAVRIYRELSARRFDAFLPDLAMSLNNLSNRLSDLGRREAALVNIEEAVRIYRKLLEVRPDAFLPDLASSLSNLSLRLSDLGRHEDALDAIEEAVQKQRELLPHHQDNYYSELAKFLNNRSKSLSELGRHEAALEPIEEAVKIRRDLSARRPDAYLPDLASSLNNLSTYWSYLGRREAALDAIEEAVQIRRELSAGRPDAFLPNLARSLGAMSRILSAIDRREEALEAIEEALMTLAPYFLKLPEAFGKWMGMMVEVYEGAQKELGGKQKAKIVPILAEIKKLLPR
ncbi:MAG: tetratricopeptide repeat protein [Magnetococcus sp. DMHC-1]